MKALRQASVLVDWYCVCSHLGERRRLTSSLLNQCYLEYDRLGDSVIGANNSREFETAKEDETSLDEDGDITRSIQLPLVLVGKCICFVRENS